MSAISPSLHAQRGAPPVGTPLVNAAAAKPQVRYNNTAPRKPVGGTA